MSPPVTPAALGMTPISFARTLRDLVLAQDEERRAARAPDRRGTLCSATIWVKAGVNQDAWIDRVAC